MSRANGLLQYLNCKANEAVVLHSGSNMFYISGYKGEGLVAFGNNFKVIITDLDIQNKLKTNLQILKF